MSADIIGYGRISSVTSYEDMTNQENRLMLQRRVSMSLDFYINVPVEGYYKRENGRTIFHPIENGKHELMLVDGITHNLGDMAMNVPVSDSLTLYNVLW